MKKILILLLLISISFTAYSMDLTPQQQTYQDPFKDPVTFLTMCQEEFDRHDDYYKGREVPETFYRDMIASEKNDETQGKWKPEVYVLPYYNRVVYIFSKRDDQLYISRFLIASIPYGKKDFITDLQRSQQYIQDSEYPSIHIYKKSDHYNNPSRRNSPSDLNFDGLVDRKAETELSSIISKKYLE